MDKGIDVQGYWWLPDDKHHKVAGWLTFNQHSAGTLRLNGALRNNRSVENVLPDGTVQTVPGVSRGRDPRYPIIHGQAGRRYFTLLGSFSSNIQHQYPTELSTEHIHVNAALECGGLFDDPDKLSFDRASVDLADLTSWVGHSGLDAEHKSPTQLDPATFGTIKATILPSFEIQTTDRTVIIGQSLAQTGDGLHSAGVEQRWGLTIRNGALRPLQEFVDTFSDLQDLGKR